MSARLTVATRKSQLALAQTRAWIAELVSRHPGLAVNELHVTTTGDRVQDRALSEIGGKGLFIKEIEEALLDGRAQIAVHSIKDVPADLAPGLSIGCIPARVDARDVVLTRDGAPLSELPAGAKVGTSSLRRRVQLAARYPRLEYVALRGNVDTRLRKLREGQVAAIVLARAGLLRLGLPEADGQVLSPEDCLPAIGQGALGIERRTDDEATGALLTPLIDADTETAVAAERGVMRAVEGSCQIPVAAYALKREGTLWLRGFLAEPDGSRPRQREVSAPWPASSAEAERIGEALGRELKGA